MDLDTEQLLYIYRMMATIRKFEQRTVDEYYRKNIPGVVHASIGQEGVAVGVCAALRRDDQIVSNHRGHGHALAKGADMKLMMAELFGRSNGSCRGKGGSMHIADFSVGMLGANGIVGAGMPIATGAGLAASLEGNNKVAVCFFGEGAANEGSFHTSLNLASIWKLPVVYVCENNQWAVAVPVSSAMAVEDVATRAVAYGIPGVKVDGTDVLAVHEVTRQAVERARAGEGPTLIECNTFRWFNHNEVLGAPPDPRPQEEIDLAYSHDPIASFAALLFERDIASRATIEQMDGEIDAAVEEAVVFAHDSPLPKPEDALLDVFAA